MSSFVIEYHRPTGRYRVTPFSGSNARTNAIRRRLDLERQHVGDDWEVVSLNADSLDVLKRTHSRYFFGQELAAS